MEENDKKIDENWKSRVKKEKQQQPQKQEPIPEADFASFISSLGVQAMVALGELKNPLTNNKEENLPQAKYLIDVLGIIEDKTKGNLNQEESQILNDLLYQLRILYLRKSK